MRMIFGVLSLLVALAIVGYLAKTQLKAVTVAPVAGVPATQVPVATPAATPAQQSQQIQRQVQDDIARAMQQAADRAASAAP